MVESNPQIPETEVANTTPQSERGRNRFSLRSALMSAVIGAVALPTAVVGLASLTGELSNSNPDKTLPALMMLGTLGATAGYVLDSLRR